MLVKSLCYAGGLKDLRLDRGPEGAVSAPCPSARGARCSRSRPWPPSTPTALRMRFQRRSGRTSRFEERNGEGNSCGERLRSNHGCWQSGHGLGFRRSACRTSIFMTKMGAFESMS